MMDPRTRNRFRDMPQIQVFPKAAFSGHHFGASSIQALPNFHNSVCPARLFGANFNMVAQSYNRRCVFFELACKQALPPIVLGTSKIKHCFPQVHQAAWHDVTTPYRPHDDCTAKPYGVFAAPATNPTQDVALLRRQACNPMQNALILQPHA